MREAPIARTTLISSLQCGNPHRNLERVCSLERGLSTANIGQPASADPEGRCPPRRTAIGAGCHGAQGGDNKHSPEHRNETISPESEIRHKDIFMDRRIG